jgi:hypothetical protein
MKWKPVLGVLGVLACGGDGTTAPKGIDVDALNGVWELQFTKTDNCGAIATQGSYYLTLDFEQSSPTVANTVSKWTNDRAVPDRFTLVGNLNPTTGAIELRMWHSVLQTGTMVTGTVSRALTWDVEGIDPIPGYNPYMSIGGCEYTVAAIRQ